MTFQRPRRLTPPAPPGSMLKHLTVVAPVPRKDATDHDPDYLALVRQCPCLSCGLDPCGEAAHVRFASAAHGKASGMHKKPSDQWALSLCAGCHRLNRDAQHNRNEYEFWNALGINPLLTCIQLYARRGDLVAMRSVIFVAIAGRTPHV